MINVILAGIVILLYVLIDIFMGDRASIMLCLPLFFVVLIVAINERSE